ncbi:MAG TPA: hypothetical protein VF615_08050 [Longimicrobiaceae bacterium]|jgi:hypothetical protein
MTATRTAPLVLLALALAAGCSGGVRVRPGAPIPNTVPGVDDPTPPLPDEALRMQRRQGGVQGVYRLVEVNDSVVPAVVDTRGGCVVRAVQGTLALQEGGFTFSGSTQESCGGTTRPAVVHRAEGRYQRDGATLRFTAGAGGTFGEATGQVLDERTLLVTRVSAGGRTRSITLEFSMEDRPR